MQVKNIKVYDMPESIQAAGYPMKTGAPPDGVKDFANIELAQKLANAKSGSGHDNFLKGILVAFDMEYTQYFTPQFQRYSFADIVSSQSKMHRLTHCECVHDNCNDWTLRSQTMIIDDLITWYNDSEQVYPLQIENVIAKNKRDLFHVIISNLPMGYQLWMRVTTNYLQLKTIYNQRKKHRLYDWGEFCQFIEKLENSYLITGK